MALVDTLDVLLHGYPGRNQLIHIVGDLVKDLATTQDEQTGLRYQIIDQGNLLANWTVTSSSSMFTYVIDIAVKIGYVSQPAVLLRPQARHQRTPSARSVSSQ